MQNDIQVLTAKNPDVLNTDLQETCKRQSSVHVLHLCHKAIYLNIKVNSHHIEATSMNLYRAYYHFSSSATNGKGYCIYNHSKFLKEGKGNLFQAQ